MKQHFNWSHSLIKMVHNTDILANNEVIVDGNRGSEIFVFETYTFDTLLHKELSNCLTLMKLSGYNIEITDYHHDIQCYYCWCYSKQVKMYGVKNPVWRWLPICINCLNDAYCNDGDQLYNGTSKILKIVDDIIYIGNKHNKIAIYYIKDNKISYFTSKQNKTTCIERYSCFAYQRKNMYPITYIVRSPKDRSDIHVSVKCEACDKRCDDRICNILSITEFNKRINYKCGPYHYFLICILNPPIEIYDDIRNYIAQIYSNLF